MLKKWPSVISLKFDAKNIFVKQSKSDQGNYRLLRFTILICTLDLDTCLGNKLYIQNQRNFGPWCWCQYHICLCFYQLIIKVRSINPLVFLSHAPNFKEMTDGHFSSIPLEKQGGPKQSSKQTNAKLCILQLGKKINSLKRVSFTSITSHSLWLSKTLGFDSKMHLKAIFLQVGSQK